MRRLPFLILMAIISILAAWPASAHPWGMGRGAWPVDGFAYRERPDSEDQMGKIRVTAYKTHSAGLAELGHGAVYLVDNEASSLDPNENAAFHAAILEQLVDYGYIARDGSTEGGQSVRFSVSHEEVQPAERRHRPISGEVAIGASNRGSAVEVGVQVDLSKPPAALIATRLDAQIIDARSGEILWEAHADVTTREGDPRWNDTNMAAKVAAAIFRHFPGRG